MQIAEYCGEYSKVWRLFVIGLVVDFVFFSFITQTTIIILL